MAHAKGCLDFPNGLRWPTPMGGGLDYLGLGELIHMQALDAGITPCIVSH